MCWSVLIFFALVFPPRLEMPRKPTHFLLLSSYVIGDAPIKTPPFLPFLGDPPRPPEVMVPFKIFKTSIFLGDFPHSKLIIFPVSFPIEKTGTSSGVARGPHPAGTGTRLIWRSRIHGAIF